MPADLFALWIINHPDFSVVGHDPDGEDDESDEDLNDIDEDLDEEESDDEDDDESDDEDDSPETLKKKLADAEKAKKKAERALAKAQKSIPEPAADDDDDDASEEVRSLREENAAFRKLLNGPYIQSQINSFVDDKGDPRWDWEDAEVVYALLDRSDLEVDPETGKIDGLEEQLEDLAERKPHLLKIAEGELRVRKSKPSGRAPGGKRAPRGDKANEAALKSMFPALQFN